MVEPSERQAEIFLAEDNLADVKLLQRFLREVPFPYHLSVVDNGEAALAFLEQHASYTEAPTPDLIILDAHLVKKSGWEVLPWVRATRSLATIPVVMLSGALSPLDEQIRDRLQPTRCLEEPTTVEEFQALVKIFEEVMSHFNSSV